jgi:hypothetical protein
MSGGTTTPQYIIGAEALCVIACEGWSIAFWIPFECELCMHIGWTVCHMLYPRNGALYQRTYTAHYRDQWPARPVHHTVPFRMQYALPARVGCVSYAIWNDYELSFRRARHSTTSPHVSKTWPGSRGSIFLDRCARCLAPRSCAGVVSNLMLVDTSLRS